jgi:sigma-E factor negative regulatory protein RseA
MNQDKIEKLSALVDGELYDQDRETLIQELQSDDDTRGRWQRYHMIGDTMRSTMPATVKPDLAASLNKLLENEPAILAPQKKPSITQHPYLKPVAGFAIAASITAVAVLGLMPANESSIPGADSTIAANEITPTTVVNTGSLAGTAATQVRTVKYEGPETENADALSPYILNHNQYNSRMGVQGVSPYARLVGHENK